MSAVLALSTGAGATSIQDTRIPPAKLLSTMPANFTVIPDDILYHIMQVDHTITCDDDRAAFDFWLACSSVSWQWRNTAITFLFRCITFLESSEASNVRRMEQLSETPHIARCIREVLFRDTIVPIASLDRFLTHLPHLRRLEVHLVKFPESDELTAQSQSGDHQIDEVCCDSFWKADRLRYDQVVRFLQLFSKIKSLVVEDVGAIDFSYKEGLSGSDEDEDSEDEESYDELALKRVPAAVATHRLGSLQIEELSLTDGWRNKSFISSFLCQTSSLSYLTSLFIVVEDPSEDLDRLNEILCAAGRTLKEARVDIVMRYDWFETNDLTGTREAKVTKLQTGFYSCVVLEKMDIDISVYNEHDCESPLTTRERKVKFPLVGWESLLDILTLVPVQSLHQLHIAFELHDCYIQEPHSLPWQRLRDICKRFLDNNLKSLSGTFPWPYCAMYEMRAFHDVAPISTAAAPLYHEMEMYYRTTCRHAECERYCTPMSIELERTLGISDIWLGNVPWAYPPDSVERMRWSSAAEEATSKL